jgi:co-chaperonin GroES (HSP10)
LVEYYEPERRESIIAIPDHVRDKEVLMEQRAVVVEVGPACWPDEPPRVKPGDRVLIAKYSGYAFKGTQDGKNYRMVNDRDIFAKITEE